jgi:Flp pilus assembly pilin Flp
MFAIINALKAAAQTPAVQGRLSERGATMVEYGIIVALISIIAVLVITALGVDVFNAFNSAENNMPTPGGPLPNS